MSVRTTADEQLDSVKGHVKSAIDALNEIVVGECWGHDDLTPEYRLTLRQTMFDLMGTRDKLENP